MKHLLLLTITLLYSSLVCTQNIVEISEGNKFYLNKQNNISILHKVNNSILELTPRFDKTSFRWEIDTLKMDFNTYETLDIFDVNQIADTSLDSILTDKKLSIQNNKQQTDLVQITNEAFAYCTYDMNSASEFEKFPSNIYNLHSIKIASRSIAVLTDNSYNTMAYFYATKEGVTLNILPSLTNTTPYNSITELKKDERTSLLKYFENFYSHYKSIPVGLKYALCNRNNRPVNESLYDMIIIGDTDILTQKDGHYTLYSKELKPINNGYIQVAYELNSGGTYIEAIIDNEHVWIKNGEKLPSNAFSYDLQLYRRHLGPSNIKYSFDPNGRNNFTLVLHPQDRFKKTTYSDSIRLNTHKPLHNYQDIVFANNFPYIGQVYDDVHSAEGFLKATLMDEGFSDYEDYAKLRLENIFVLKDGKWGIDSLQVQVFKRTFELIELLPAEFDKLEELPYPSLDIVTRGSSNHLGWKRQPVIFYKNKLMGVYPMNQEAKYKKIDKSITGRYFYRAILSSGEGAWLDIRSRKEIPDI